MEQYGILAAYYDRLTTDVDYQKWAAYVQKHFCRSKLPIRSVAELACGTGSLAALLARQGYSVTALDLSPDMLTAAADKCAGLDVTLVCQDMSHLSLPVPADAVICCLDSINYITRSAALRRTFQRVYHSLKPGGLFLFDVKTPHTLESADGQIYLDEGEDLYCVWRGEYHSRRRICSYGIDLFALQPDGSWLRGEEYHEEYAYTLEELERYLHAAGFQTIRQYGNLKMSSPSPRDERVFFAARKEP